jgi:hypothetical protein
VAFIDDQQHDKVYQGEQSQYQHQLTMDQSTILSSNIEGAANNELGPGASEYNDQSAFQQSNIEMNRLSLGAGPGVSGGGGKFNVAAFMSLNKDGAGRGSLESVSSL